MTRAETLPAPDFDLSPYTGWTRAHWEHVLARLTCGYVLAAERQGSPARALFPDDRCDRPDAVDALEALARIATAWGAWLHNPANPSSLRFAGREMDVARLLRQALLEGTDRANPHTYWGDIGHMDQRIVEAANLAIALWLSRARVFDRMSADGQAQVMAWIAQVDGKATWPDNWILFPAMTQAARRRLGYPFDEADLDARLDQIAAFYRGEGWYADGEDDAFELYNAWMFGWHFLAWAWMDGDRRPDLRDATLQRARSFLAGFQHFFGANGAYVAWGRSLTGRFAASVAFQMGHLLGIAPASPGRLRRIASGCLRYFVEHGCIDDQDHRLLQGYHGNYPPAGESYAAPGSPLSACCALLALAFDAGDPFWTEREEPLPVEERDFDLAFLCPGFAVSGRRSSGQVILLNSRSGHGGDVPRPDYVPKYGKFAYTTHFPFNVTPVSGSYGADAALTLTHDGATFGHRDLTRDGGAAPGMIWSEFDVMAAGEAQRVWAAVLLWNEVQVRLARLRPTLPVRAVESPGALGCAGAREVCRRSGAPAGWEYAEAEGRALAILRLLGYDGQAASAPWLGTSNINLAYAYAEQPLVFEQQVSPAPRALAAASLVRPGPFDPAAEFAGLRVEAGPADSFRVRFAGGEEAFVSLADDAPRSAALAGLEMQGVGLRCLRAEPGGGQVCGMGLTQVAGIVCLDQPGVLRLARRPGGAHVTTEAGLSISREWLGGAARQVRVAALDGARVDVSDRCAGNLIPDGLVREWAARNEQRLIEFELSL